MTLGVFGAGILAADPQFVFLPDSWLLCQPALMDKLWRGNLMAAQGCRLPFSGIW